MVAAGVGRRRPAVAERVMVRKSPKRTLSVTVRPGQPVRAAAGRRPRRPGAPARAASVSSRWWSRAKVSSWPIDLGWLVGLDRRGRRCALASAWRCAPGGRAERARPASSTGSAARSPTVRDAEALAAGPASPGPTPHSACTGSGWRNASSSPASTTFTPEPGRGPCRRRPRLGRLDASLATNFDRRHAHRAGEALLVEHPRRGCAAAIVGAGAVQAPGAASRRGTPRRARSARPAGVNDAEDRHDPRADLAVAVRGRPAGTRRAGTAAGPAPTASPSARRSARAS